MPLFRGRAAPLRAGCFALGFRQGLPSFPKLTAFFRRKVPEPSRTVPDFLLVVGRQFSEFLVPLPDLVPLLGWELLPSFELILGLLALLGGHTLPPIDAPAQTVLPFGRKGIPAIFEGLEGLLFLRGQSIPGASRRLAPGEGCETQE